MSSTKNQQFFQCIIGLRDTQLAILRQILVDKAKEKRRHNDFYVQNQRYSGVSSNGYNSTMDDIVKINNSIPKPVKCFISKCSNEGTIHSTNWADDKYVCEDCYTYGGRSKS